MCNGSRRVRLSGVTLPEPAARPPPQASAGREPQPLAQAPGRPGATGNPGKTDFHQTVSNDQKINIHLDLGRTEEQRGNFEGAIAEYQKALDACSQGAGLRPGSRHVTQRVLAHRRLGGALDHLGRFEQADAHYRAASKLAPNDPKVWNDLGYSHYLRREWGVAVECLTRAAALAPNDPRIQTNLGLSLAGAGKIDEATEHLSKAGGPAVARVNLGYLLASLGKPEEAREEYRKALALQPQLDVARQALAHLGENVRTAQAPTRPLRPELAPKVRDESVHAHFRHSHPGLSWCRSPRRSHSRVNAQLGASKPPRASAHSSVVDPRRIGDCIPPRPRSEFNNGQTSGEAVRGMASMPGDRNHRLRFLVISFCLALAGVGAAPSSESKLWSLSTVRRPDVPPVGSNPWVRNPIDSFVLKRFATSRSNPPPPPTGGP